jgi:hypothetical protein
VDGLDQTPYRPGKPAKGEPVSTARLLGRCTRPGLDVLRAEVTSPCYDAVHTRTVAFVGGDYWIVHDRLRAPGEHEYAARRHLAPGPASLGDGRVTAPGLLLVTAHGRLSVEDGWVSPSYGHKDAAPVAVLSARGADVDLVTVLLPDCAAASVSADCAGERVTVRVERRGVGVDTVRWDGTGEPHRERSC